MLCRIKTADVSCHDFGSVYRGDLGNVYCGDLSKGRLFV
jgi:hypothetical protein